MLPQSFKFKSSLKRVFGSLLVAIAFGTSANSAAAIAAERIVLTYGTFGRSLSVEELDTFATTGEQSPSLQAYFRMSRADPKPVRQSLSQPIEADPVLLDRALNSWVGNVLLDRLGAVIQTPSNRANRQALRSALVLSASDDSQMTLLEILQNYPTSELHVKGELLVETYFRLKRFERRIEQIL